MNSKRPNFIEALFGILAEPGSMTETLLEEDTPPYGFTCLLCLSLTIGVPMLVQYYKYASQPIQLYNLPAVASIFLVFFITLAIFLVLESLLFAILRIPPKFVALASLLCYCLFQLMFALWLVYFFNYLSDGYLSIVEYALTGIPSVSQRFMSILPIAFLIIQINVFLVFFYGVRTLGRLETVNAFALTLVSLVPFYLSLIIAIFLGDLVREGTIEIFQDLLTNSSSIGFLY